ncbi:hypothetical protein GCM10012275_30400 [Longimycelium tulufanense]|uniref:Uncharacterized protein n=1 Tax=Longimycelium tulufanense TaxID=907463 RepID=A0A8J3CF22_9PSEU|nr:hypothetical protein [Longimycelium tulufanense]GGM57203.1 hypothetical protein GCM10012275_30400 [Longimycelium tulufanense]
MRKKNRTVRATLVGTAVVATLLTGAVTANAAPAGPEPVSASSPVEAGHYALQLLGHDGATTHFKITFGGDYALDLVGGHLRILDKSGKVVEDISPKITTPDGRQLTGHYSLKGDNRFDFTQTSEKKVMATFFDWGSFLCGAAGTIGGAALGGIIGGPIGAGAGIGYGLAASATCS